jgi:hypothetical protein
MFSIGFSPLVFKKLFNSSSIFVFSIYRAYLDQSSPPLNSANCSQVKLKIELKMLLDCFAFSE